MTELDDPVVEADDETQGETADDHLADLEDGSGCTEIWEHLSERRAETQADD